MADNRDRTDYFRRVNFYKNLPSGHKSRPDILRAALASYRLWKNINNPIDTWNCVSVREMNKYPTVFNRIRKMFGK